MSFEFESVNHSFQEVSQDRELQHRSQSDTSGELSNSELEAVAAGGGKPNPMPEFGDRICAPFRLLGGFLFNGFRD